MDRETRDAFDLIDEIEKTLALKNSAPLTWTIGRGRSLASAYESAQPPDAARQGRAAVCCRRPRDPRVAELLPEHERAQAIEEAQYLRWRDKAIRQKAFLEGHIIPILWGSALKDFGVKDLIDALAEFAPSPRAGSPSAP